MADSTRLKDVLEHQKKQEILLIEEKALREASQQHIQVQFENMANVQSSLKGSMATVEENQKLLQQQMQGIIDQLQAYNRNNSLLGAGLTANPDHGSTSQPPPTRTRLHDSEGTRNQTIYDRFDDTDPELMIGEFNKLHQTGHRCKNRQIFLIMTEEEEEAYTADANQIEFQDEGVALEDMTVSLNAIGSTNCFLDEETALRLGCTVEYTTPMMVSVANGSKLISRTYSPEFTWSIQGQSFTYPVRIIKLRGCDLVLGGDWLRKYSPIEFDYDRMKLTISRSGKKIALKAITENSELKLISAKFPQFNMQPALQTQHSSPLQVHMSADPTHTPLEFSTAPPHLDSTTANQLSNEPALNSISQDFPQDATLSPSAKISVAVQHLQDHIFTQSVSSITPTTSKIRHSHTQPIQILTTSIHSTTNLSTQSPNFDPPFLHNFPPCGQGFQNPRGNVTITGRIGTFDFNRSIAKKIRSHRSRRIKDYKTSRTEIKDLNDNVQLMSCLSQDSPHHHLNDAVSINANSAHTHVPPSDEFHPTITKDSTSSI
ncbi:hypothetical protein BUALT_Bualt05G0046500 [Buddleja alternifolia]|uniref:Reverse transcriptase domain-containing protein n=1 Tax=Buddleja alternifolia TaxID=168488 RepID=A0AAV6XSQ0_9LAMI|nr:hypothetical protein BUALT_Bualt05G0046500 [Buddleja alternifolia]